MFLLGKENLSQNCFLNSALSRILDISALVQILLYRNSELQVRTGNRDNFPYICIKNIHCDPSLEPSCQEGSNEGLQCIFLFRNKNYLRIIPVTPFYLEL